MLEYGKQLSSKVSILLFSKYSKTTLGIQIFVSKEIGIAIIQYAWY